MSDRQEHRITPHVKGVDFAVVDHSLGLKVIGIVELVGDQSVTPDQREQLRDSIVRHVEALWTRK